jgi:hypothetical protein
MLDPQFIEPRRLPLFQIAQAPADTPPAIQRQDVPATLVDGHFVPSVRGQVVNPNRAIAQIDQSTHPLHFSQKLVIPPVVHIDVPENLWGSGPGRGQDDKLCL